MKSFTLNKNTITRNSLIVVFAVICLILIIGGVLITKNKNNTNSQLQNERPGTLVVNTDKTQYSTNEQVIIQITHLDDQGKPLCNDELQMEILNNNEVIEEPEITLSPTCGQENYSFNPDYTAFFTPKSEGKYLVRITSPGNTESTETSISVGESTTDFSITRWGPTKLVSSPDKRYPMKLIITAKKDFSGQVIEQIPNSLEIVWNGPAKVEGSSEHQTLTWDINVNNNETKELVYEYKVTKKTSGTYNLGKAKITENGKVIFEEDKTWTLITQNI